MARKVRKKPADASRPAMQPGGSRRFARDSVANLAINLVLLIALAIVFAQTLWFDFVNFDDKAYVYQNPQVQRGLTWQGFAWAFGHFHQCNWHPLTWLSHMADCSVYRVWPGGHHLSSVLLHAATSLLLFAILRRMTGRRWPSACAAMLFAIHPLHVESVAWVAERKDVLSGLFFVLTLAAYWGYVRRPHSLARYLTVVLCFALGLMAKPMLVTLPLVLLLLDYWPLRRWGVAWACVRRETSRRIVIEKIPLFVLSAASCAVTLMAQSGAIKPLQRFPWTERAASAVVSLGNYLLEVVWPSGLAAFYPYSHHQPLAAIAGSLALLAGVSAAAVVWRRRFPYLLVGWLWYLIMLVPVVGLVQVGDQASADRYMYLPLIGPAVALSFAAAEFAGTSILRRQVCGVAGAIAFSVLMVVAWRQTSSWRDSDTLWTKALTCTRDNWMALTNRGSFRMRNGRLDDAIADYQAALEIRQNLPLTHNNLALALGDRGDKEGAFVHFRAAICLDPSYAEAHGNYAMALAGAGQTDRAVMEFDEALRIQPDYAEAHNNYGLTLAGMKKFDAAIGHFREALRISPDDAEACYNLGTALYYRGQFDEAAFYLEKAATLKPGLTPALQVLDAIRQARGKRP